MRYLFKFIFKNKVLGLFLILLLGAIDHTYSQTPLRLEKDQEMYILGEHLKILEDSSRSLEMSEVLTQSTQYAFEPSTQLYPNFGLTNSAYWAKIALFNPEENTQNWWIENGYAIMHYVDIYVFDENGALIMESKGGSQYPFAQRLVDYRKNLFPLEIPSKTTYTCLFRFQSQTSMQLLLRAWKPLAFAEKIDMELYFWGCYSGIILAIILYNLFVAISIKSRSYSYYIVYIGSFAIIQLTIEGLAYQYLWPEAVWWANNCIPFLILVAGFSSAAFAQGFLLTNTSKATWLHSSLGFIRKANMVLLLVIFLPYSIGIKISALMAVIDLSLLSIAGLIRWREGYRPARFFVLAWFTFILGVMLLLMKNFGLIPTNFLTSNTAPIGSALEAILLSVALADRLKVLTQERDRATQEALSLQEEKNEELEQKVEERTQVIAEKNSKLIHQNEEIASQRDLLEDQNRQITASITYAERIQRAMLPALPKIKSHFQDCFVLLLPRDIVSGDFYWFRQVESGPDSLLIMAAVDCTGHGVPGAFMSMLGNELLDEIIHQRRVHSPDLILRELNNGIQRILKQRESGNKDGMDISLVVLNPKKGWMQFSGAKNPLIYIQDGALNMIRGDKLPIGGVKLGTEREYTCYKIDITKPTSFYLFSDGYQDQFGGDNNRKFMTTRFRELLLSIHKEPMKNQKEILLNTLHEWKGDNKQVDDILVMGFQATPPTSEF